MEQQISESVEDIIWHSLPDYEFKVEKREDWKIRLELKEIYSKNPTSLARITAKYVVIASNKIPALRRKMLLSDIKTHLLQSPLAFGYEPTRIYEEKEKVCVVYEPPARWPRETNSFEVCYEAPGTIDVPRSEGIDWIK